MDNDNKQNLYEPAPNSNLDRYRKIQSLEDQQTRTLDKKHLFLVGYEKSMGNIKRACEYAGIKSRKTFYNWCKVDKDFKAAVDSTLQVQRDFIEDLALMKILKNHGPTIRWYLTKKHPGYKLRRGGNPPQKPDDVWKRWEKMPWPDDKEESEEVYTNDDKTENSEDEESV